MRAPLAVVDTNVVVSGLLTNQPDAPTARILDGMREGRFPFLLSGELLDEYRAVLLRPKIHRRHGLTETEVDQILTELVANARFTEPARIAGKRREPDGHLWALASVVPGCVLVTGDRPLGRSRRENVTVLSPREFVGLYFSRTSIRSD